jgi:hypothetical protein
MTLYATWMRSHHLCPPCKQSAGAALPLVLAPPPACTLLDCSTASTLTLPPIGTLQVMYEMGEPYASSVELLSFHTVSKVSRGPPHVVVFWLGMRAPVITPSSVLAG